MGFPWDPWDPWEFPPSAHLYSKVTGYKYTVVLRSSARISYRELR